MTGRQGSRGGDEQHDHLGGDQRSLYPLFELDEHRQDREVADRRHAGDQGDAAEDEVVGIRQEAQPTGAPVRARYSPTGSCQSVGSASSGTNDGMAPPAYRPNATRAAANATRVTAPSQRA